LIYLYNEPRKERKVIVARKKQHYVDNEKFLVVMTDYREKYLQAKDDEEELPIIPDYAGECFLKIAERLSHRPNFINYAFREEMVSDGIENCVMYAGNFNPEKSTNPFAYFTQIIYFAFLRRIEKEKKQLYIKYKTMEEHSSLEDHVDMGEMGSEERGQLINVFLFKSSYTHLKRKNERRKRLRLTRKMIISFHFLH